MKSSKIWRIIWIIGIYAILIVILYLVVLYKVEWEHKDLNTYLYLYDCNHELCTSSTSQDDYYSKVLCEDDICPYISNINNEYLILERDNISWIYNYIQDEVVNNKYTNYKYIGNDMYVVKNNDGYYGVIELNGNVLVDLKYDYIDDYKNGLVSYIKNNLYGIISIDDGYEVEPLYEDVVLINDKIFAGKKENVYHLYSYDDINNDNTDMYNFVYSYNDIIIVVNNNKLDILNTNLDSTLLMKIDTFYEYTTEQERDSLQIYSDDEFIYFKVFVNEDEYIAYKYDIKNNKLI